MKEIFSLPPLVAYKHPANIKDKVVRSKMPTRKRRIKRGMHHCGSHSCRTCQLLETGKVARATASQEVVEINAEVNCQDSDVIYLITCLHCKEQYIGETKHKLSVRFSQHQGYVKSREQTTGKHFSGRGHDILDMRITILEKLHKNDENHWKERESMWIRKFNTKNKGINRNS